MEKYIYLVYHQHLVNDLYTEWKQIGVFSSEEKANQAIDISIKLPGFRDYSRSCYKIEKYLINDYSKWLDGYGEQDLILLN